MLPRKLRVHKAVFAEVLKKGLSFHSPHIVLRGIKKDDITPSTFSVTVPKKVAILSVDRNLLRRRAISSVEGFIPEIKKGVSAVFLFKTGSLGLSFDQIKKEITALLKQSGLIL